MKISLVILTLNEIVGLQTVFASIPKESVDEIIAIDGGSHDGTVEFFAEHNIPCYKQEKRGRGEAFRLAIQVSSCDAFIFFSPDGNEDPLDIPKFFPLLLAGSDVVIANRMSDGGHNEEDECRFPLRKWVNNAFTFAANFVWNKGAYVHDTINGFRAITRFAWDRVSLDGDGYTIEYQMTIRAFKLGLRIKEFPTYESKRIDEGRGSPSLDTGVAFIKMFFKELWSR